MSKPCCNKKSADYTGKNRIVIKIDECLKLYCECGTLQRVLKGTKISGVVHLSDDYMILTMNDVDNKNPLYSLNVSDNQEVLLSQNQSSGIFMYNKRWMN